MDNSTTSVESLINSGFARRFHQVFGLPIFFSNTPDKRAVAAKVMQDKNLKYPLAFASFTSRSLAENRYSPHSLLRRGIYGNATSDNVQTFRLRMLPVTTSFGLTLLSEDWDTIDKFTKQWLFCVQEGSLKFSLTYGVVKIDIHVDLDREVQFPTRSGGLDEPKEFELTSAFRIEGYINKPLERAQAANEVEIEGRLNSALDQNDRREQGHSVQVFRFNRPWPNIDGPAASEGDTRDKGV